MLPRLTARTSTRNCLILFDAYVHGNLDRRGFLVAGAASSPRPA